MSLASAIKSRTHTLETPGNRRINAVDRTKEVWQKRTGELPPRFSDLPSHPFLPNVLSGVRTSADWTRRKAEIRAQVEHWMTGRMPPAPDNLRAVITAEGREGDVTVRDVPHEFGLEHRGILHLQLLIPAANGPLPVFLSNHQVSLQLPVQELSRIGKNSVQISPKGRRWIYSSLTAMPLLCLFQLTSC
jgi:hypothetical protein